MFSLESVVDGVNNVEHNKVILYTAGTRVDIQLLTTDVTFTVYVCFHVGTGSMLELLLLLISDKLVKIRLKANYSIKKS